MMTSTNEANHPSSLVTLDSCKKREIKTAIIMGTTVHFLAIETTKLGHTFTNFFF